MAALTSELELAPALAPVCEDVGVLTVRRLRDRMKELVIEYGTPYDGQEIFPDQVTEENYLHCATQDLQRVMEELKVAFQNKTLALQRIQIMDSLRNQVYQGDNEDSCLILETMKHIVQLSQKIIKYQQQVHQKEQQFIDTKRKRLSLKKDGEQKLRQIHTMMKRQNEKQASVKVTETKMLDKLKNERDMTTMIQNVFQNMIIGSKVNWAEDPSLKAIVLQLGKNVCLH